MALAKKPVAEKKLPTKPVTSSQEYSPLAMVLYGPSGVGKTEMAAAFPAPGFIYEPQEDGIKDLVESHLCDEPVFMQETPGFQETIEMHEEIAANGCLSGGGDKILTLVNDALTGMERQCFVYHCDEYYEGDWSDKGFYSFYKGPENASRKDWPRYIASLIAVWKAGINVILIGHSKVGDTDNPSGDDYKQFMPQMDKRIWAQTHNWAKCILYYGLDTETETDAKKKIKSKSASFDRNLYTQPSPHYIAKNRYGLSPIITGGDSGKEAYAAFAADLARARKSNQL